MDKYIGFDIDNKKTVACVVQNGKKDQYATMKTDLKTMQHYLLQQKQPNTKIHLTFEVCGQAGYRHDALKPYVDTLTVSNPNKTTWIYRTSKKNDRIDARKQAVLLSINELSKVHIPEQAVRQWRVSIKHRHHIVSTITAVKNRIRALLKGNGFTRPVEKGSWWKKINRLWMHELSELKPITPETLWQFQLADLLDELALLEKQLKRITDYLDQYLTTQPQGCLLMSIPGVGPRTAEAVLAWTDDVKRFKRNKEYGGYFGLTPKLDESGQIRRLGHISKQGPSLVRGLLVECAWRAIRYSKALGSFYDRILCGQKNRRKTAVVAVARKLLMIMRAMLLNGELFNESLVGQSNPTARLSA